MLWFKNKKKEDSLNNIYELLIDFNNNERQNAKASEKLSKTYEKSNIELTKELEKKDALLEEKDKEISRLEKINKDQLTENQKLHEYLEKIAEILKANQKNHIQKPTKVDLMTEKMNKISKEAKAKLR